MKERKKASGVVRSLQKFFKLARASFCADQEASYINRSATFCLSTSSPHISLLWVSCVGTEQHPPRCRVFENASASGHLCSKLRYSMPWSSHLYSYSSWCETQVCIWDWWAFQVTFRQVTNSVLPCPLPLRYHLLLLTGLNAGYVVPLVRRPHWLAFSLSQSELSSLFLRSPDGFMLYALDLRHSHKAKARDSM